MTVAYRKCSIEEIQGEGNLGQMLREYAEESAIEGLPNPCAQMETYRVLETMGMEIHGAFVDGLLVGFVTVLISPLPHYGVTIGVTESLFVMKAHRKKGIGLRLLRVAELSAQIRGAKGVLVSSPAGGALEKVLSLKSQYRKTNSVFFKGDL